MKSESTYTMTSSIIIFLVTMIACFELGFCRDDPFIRIIKTHNCDKTFEIDSIGRFAVEQHNKQQNSLLEFAKVLNAREQVVAGKIYHLTLEAIDAGKIKIYDAKVWVKPWMNFKQLQEFKIKDGSLFTSADLGLKHESNGLEWSVVPTFDQTVKDAAVHAVKAIQNRSNSLFPYHLLEILKAKAKVIKDSTEFALLLKVRRGNTDEKFNVVMNKKIGGVFYLHQMEQDHS